MSKAPEELGCFVLIGVIVLGMVTCTGIDTFHDLKKADIESRERIEILKITGKLPPTEP